MGFSLKDWLIKKMFKDTTKYVTWQISCPIRMSKTPPMKYIFGIGLLDMRQ